MVEVNEQLCYSVLFEEFDFSNSECMTLMVSKILGVVMIVGLNSLIHSTFIY